MEEGMKNIFKFISCYFALMVVLNCDSPKKNTEGLGIQFYCKVLATQCESGHSIKYGMVGDSWTDILFGTEVIETLRVQLEKYHGYKIIGSTAGGQEMSNVLNQNIYIKVIEEGGAELKYMLVSLGGNDLLGNVSQYNGRIDEEKKYRLDQLKSNLLTMIRNGNAYKVNRFGGAPLLWIVHGYDYPNPDILSMADSTFCRPTLREAGLSDQNIATLLENLDELNSLYIQLTTIEPQLRYIDLRKTLGGPPSTASMMFDCIHPNSFGFKILGDSYARGIEGYTNNDK
jgi:hypothetical protein